LIGNIRDITPGKEWVTYAEWSRQYSTTFQFFSARHQNSDSYRLGFDLSQHGWHTHDRRQLG
jgi:hypothetical protein